VVTEFAAEKLLRQVRGHAPGFGVAASGYEIRHGRVSRHAGEPLLELDGAEEEGCVAGAVFGTSWHGLLEHDDFRRAFLSRVAARRGRNWRPGDEPFADVRERHLDRLGDLVEEHLDTDALMGLISRGAPADLPVLARELV
jgi:adenosylcobyric acid synthase